MPGAAEGGDALLVRLLQHGDDVGMARHALDIGHAQHGAEPARQRDLGLRAQPLAAEEQHEMIGEGAPELAEGAIVDPSEIEAGDFRAEAAGDRRDLHH